jgi:hypothetical protein
MRTMETVNTVNFNLNFISSLTQKLPTLNSVLKKIRCEIQEFHRGNLETRKLVLEPFSPDHSQFTFHHRSYNRNIKPNTTVGKIGYI